jgi:hypothetical protein
MDKLAVVGSRRDSGPFATFGKTHLIMAQLAKTQFPYFPSPSVLLQLLLHVGATSKG